jgi:anti-anti-sigma regulatory factor
MELAYELRDGVAIVSISGYANQAPDRISFHEYVKSLASDGHTLIIVDFSALSWIGSNLLGALIACYCSLRASGGGLRVVSAGPKIVQAITFN